MVKIAPGAGQTWTDYVRQLLSFIFGVVIIVYGVFISTNSIVPELVIGLLLMGIIPLDLVLGKLGLGNGKVATPSDPPPAPTVTVEAIPAERSTP